MASRRVLVLCGARGIPLHGPSGASAHLRGVSRALATAGHHVCVAVPLASDHRGRHDHPLGVAHVDAPPRSWRWLGPLAERGETWDARRLVRAAIAEHGVPDLIYERHALFCDAGHRLARSRGIPRVVELNAPLALERERFYRLRDRAYAARMERKLLRSADRVNAVSAWLAAWAGREGGVDPAKIRHVPNGVDYRGAGARDATRRRLELTGLVIGFVGSLKPWHGLHRIPAILDRLPDATALIAGSGPERLPEHKRIRWLGHLEHSALADAISAFDVAIAPYDSDAPPWFCPLKILEYRSQGVPVVAANIGDCAQLVGEGGEIVGSDDPAQWAEAIRRQAEAPRRPVVRTWTEVLHEALSGLPA